MKTIILSTLLALPTVALADGPPEEYQQGLWRSKTEVATIGAVVAAVGVASSGAGIALYDRSDMPAELLIVSGALGSAGGATVMSIAALSARDAPLNRSNSAVGSYLALSLVGVSGIGMASLTLSDDPVTHDALLYGSAGVAATAILPAIAQLAGNKSAWNNRNPKTAWAPIATPDRLGAVAMVTF